MLSLIIIMLFMILALAIGPIVFKKQEKRDWNNGYCSCGNKWRYFDTDSQGTEGYRCDKCGSIIWLSWIHPRNKRVDYK